MVGRGPYNKIRLDPLKPETYAHPTFGKRQTVLQSKFYNNIMHGCDQPPD
jgi:hypothetical protein